MNEALGALNYYDLFGGGGYTNRYSTAHEVSSLAASVLFAGNLSIALFAPNPYPKTLRFGFGDGPSDLHVQCSAAGIVTEIVLGFFSATRAGQLDQRDFARAHLVIGTTTTAFVYAGALAYVFLT